MKLKTSKHVISPLHSFIYSTYIYCIVYNLVYKTCEERHCTGNFDGGGCNMQFKANARVVMFSFYTGEYEKGVDHLTNAIAVCGQPQQLLQVLQQTLPPPVFQMLLTKLPTISQV